MGKIQCEIIKDLLPLYNDDICSEESRKLVEEHLSDCSSCKGELEKIQAAIILPAEVTQNNLNDEGALKAISVFWNRSKVKAFAKGIAITASLFMVCILIYIGLFHWNITNVPTSIVKITNVCKLKDGRIAYHVKLTDGYNLNEVKFHMDDDGNYYITPYRPIIKTKVKTESGLPNMYYLFDPAGHAAYEQRYGKAAKIKTLYYGTQKDRILIWKEGMNLPQASKEIEAQLNDEQDFPMDWKNRVGGR